MLEALRDNILNAVQRTLLRSGCFCSCVHRVVSVTWVRKIRFCRTVQKVATGTLLRNSRCRSDGRNIVAGSTWLRSRSLCSSIQSSLAKCHWLRRGRFHDVGGEETTAPSPTRILAYGGQGLIRGRCFEGEWYIGMARGQAQDSQLFRQDWPKHGHNGSAQTRGVPDQSCFQAAKQVPIGPCRMRQQQHERKCRNRRKSMESSQ